MRRPIRQRGSAHESQTWWRGFFGEGFFCELRLYGVLGSSPACTARSLVRVVVHGQHIFGQLRIHA